MRKTGDAQRTARCGAQKTGAICQRGAERDARNAERGTRCRRQPAFPGLRDAMRKKVTRREQFLAEMDAVVPWGRLLALIAPHYSKVGPKGGRPPMPPEVMLRVCFLQNWYALSDPMAEKTLYDSEAMRRLAGIELGDDRIPDETTILKFRHLLEQHGLTEAIFADVNAQLADKGITLRSGTLVDATIIDAPSSTKNKARARDPEMSSTKKGNDWYFGMKAHIGVDADSGVTHSLETTTAKLHDSQVWDALLHGDETSVWADKGYVFADGGYAGPKLRGAPIALGRWTLQIVKRSDSARGFELLPRRWVVERTFAWLGRCRPLAKDWEKSIESAEAWVLIAHIRRMARLLATD